MGAPQASLFATGRGLSASAASSYNHPAVALYRQVCRYKPNEPQRRLIIEAVGDSSSALSLYIEILDQFMAEGRPPQRVDWTLERFANAHPPAFGSQPEPSAPPVDEAYDGPIIADSSAEGQQWRSLLFWIQTRLSQESYELWFRDLRLAALDEVSRSIRILAPNGPVKNWVRSNYSSLLEDALEESGWDGFSIVWVVSQTEERVNA